MLGLDALVLFRQRRMALFFLFAMLLGAALQITNTFGNPFLHDLSLNPLYQDSLSVRYPAVLLSLSQISEVFFILTIPFFLRRYGIKQVMLISMAARTLRFPVHGLWHAGRLWFRSAAVVHDRLRLCVRLL